MKNLLCLTLTVCLFLGLQAQEENSFYATFEFMEVKEGMGEAYWETEKFWGAIHQERANSGDIVGWDLWSMQPSGTKQGPQFLVVTLFSSREEMFTGNTWEEIQAYAKKAYPDMSEEDMEAGFKGASTSRELVYRYFMEGVASTTGGPDLEEGTVATFDFMKAHSSDYSKMEQEIFMPMHQEAVDAGEKRSWDLMRIVLPYGKDSYASHMTINMYKDMSQFAKSWGSASGSDESSYANDIAIEKGLKTRDLMAVKLAVLETMIRKVD